MSNFSQFKNQVFRITVQRLPDLALAWIFPLLLVLLWQVSSNAQWIPEQVLPTPWQVVDALQTTWQSGELLDNLRISAVRVILGFGIGALTGLALGIGLGLSRSFNAYVFPIFKAISQVPVIGWLPLLMLLVGIDEALKFLLIAKATLVPVAVNTCQGIQGVSKAHVEVAKVLRLSRWQLLTKVVFPAATAQIWTGLRYGFTHAWLALVVVELLASSEGIGFMIVYGRQLFQLDIVLAAVVVVGVIGFLIDKGLSLAEARLLRWRRQGV